MPTPALEVDHGRILLAGTVLVHLERTIATSRPLPPTAVPRPYGLAPISIVGPDMVLAALAPEEAAWLGFQAVDQSNPVTLRVRAEANPTALDAVTGGRWRNSLVEAPRNYLVCPPDYCLPGMREPTGHAPFGRGELTVFALAPSCGQVSVQVVGPKRFAEATGIVPEPLDPDSAYKGWRLP